MPTYLGLEEGAFDAEETLEKRGSGLQVRIMKLTQCHYVLGDTNADTEVEILGVAGIPELGSLLRNMRCRSRKPSEENTVKHPTTGVLCGLWKVTCEFDSDIDEDQGDNNNNGGGNNDNTEPTNLRPKRRRHTEKVEEILEANADDATPIQTTAGEPIIITDEIPHPAMDVTKYESYPFLMTKFYRYSNHTNSRPFYGAPPGCALLDDIQTEEETVNGRLYERVTYTIRFRLLKYRPFNLVNLIVPDGWDLEVPNQGYLHRPRRYTKSFSGAQIEVEPGPATTFLDSNGHPKKVNLDEKGRVLLPGQQPLTVKVQRKIKVDFTPLNLEF
jgi:hypothetical protein